MWCGNILLFVQRQEYKEINWRISRRLRNREFLGMWGMSSLYFRGICTSKDFARGEKDTFYKVVWNLNKKSEDVTMYGNI